LHLTHLKLKQISGLLSKNNTIMYAVLLNLMSLLPSHQLVA